LGGIGELGVKKAVRISCGLAEGDLLGGVWGLAKARGWSHRKRTEASLKGLEST